MEIKKAKVSIWDIEQLACKITGLDYDEIDADTSVIEDKLYEEFEIDLDNFAEIIARLLPLIDVGESPLTKKVYKGFADNENRCWLVKTEV
ncbi:hypothetical protein [Capnocytophaga canimorsus]|uniref:hypothetical protein n=1 Tax=Capnocytophaga canimorsus TaxID=28188 RepID=UPI0028E3CE58|nr:hypothetical protein [Capnocytophaga canimorsus]MDT9499157.1 hypothetical protein [Capnocytophaga canimorsus]